MNDTSMQMQLKYNKLLMSLTPSERLRMVSGMYETGRKLVISGIQNRRKQLNSTQLRGQFFLRTYGNDFTAAQIKRIINKIPNMQLDVDA